MVSGELDGRCHIREGGGGGIGVGVIFGVLECMIVWFLSSH